MYSSTLPLTSAPIGGGWSKPRPGRFTPGKDALPTVQEAGQPERVRKNLPPPEFEPILWHGYL